ncbi:GNAT family N-acetyltransferase [Marmoricola sp. RAF53]|uniref:GNAT family N-acetyltransferase n=1 Tax=Marmoricola sp. RAF53 TaxID=3233059 RepID=UPI003F947030
MARKVERLTLDNLGLLPGGCATCTFWEFDPVHRARIRGHEAEEKAAWVSTMLREWGSVGRVISVDDVVAGHIEWAPALHLPGSSGFATAPVSSDAVLLASAYVDPGFRDQGLGRVLIQSMAKDLLGHGGVRAVEAFGAHRPREGECVLPVDFLLAVGFKTHRPHPQYPRMRMDLRTTLTWREEIEAAAERLLGVVTGKRPAPSPAPRPAPRGVHRSPVRPGRHPGAPRGAR